jgi:hypothetical protein
LNLAQLQQSFQAHVLSGEPGIADEIVSDPRAAGVVRLGVYGDAYASRLVEVLGASFPALHRALGAPQFARWVGEFVRAHPSRVRSARDYGDALPQWLSSRASGPRAQGLADLARFEWAIAGAFDAADRAALSPASLAPVPPAHWPALQFGFSPSLRRLSVASNCLAWWKFACEEQPRPGRWRATCPQQWLVWRRDLAVCYRRLPLAETRALDAALAGSTFGQCCEQLDSPATAATLLHRWFSEGLVAVVNAAPPGNQSALKIALRTPASGA